MLTSPEASEVPVSRSSAEGQARYALAVLLLAYILSFIDRNVMAVLIGPIRAQFDISDFQYSLLHGFAFSMFYIVLGLPIARLADKSNRKWIITIGVFCWSIMTCLCGTARSFGALFVARIGVGVGEAALSPPAFSLLSDVFPAEKLARAMAVFSLGITLGGGLAYIVGGAIYEHFAASGDVVLPLFGVVSPWQMTFIAVGAPGFLIVILLGFLKEPQRQEGIGTAKQHTSLTQVWQQLRDHRRAYVSLMGAMSLLSLLGYGTMAWYPEYLIRTFDMDRAAAGGQFGLIFLTVGSLGALAAGWSVQPLADRGFRDAPLRIILAVSCLWLVPACLGPLAPNASMAIIAACPIVFFLNAHYSVGVAGLQFITPNRMRAQISALMLFMTNLFGLAFGPSIVAFLTDFVFGDDLALRYSLLVLPLLVCPAAAVMILLGMAPYRRALDSV
jgi:MFS family permease